MPKLLLLQPPVQDFYDTDIRLQPLGLCYLKAAVKQHLPEVEVTVRDFHHGAGRFTVNIPKDFRNLRDFYACPDQSPFSTFFHYYHFGAPFEKIAGAVAQEKPDWIGISSLFTPYYREVLACAAAIKSRLNVPVIVGGSHVSLMPEAMLGDPAIDFVIRGEGEKPLVEFLKAQLSGQPLNQVPNLGFKQNGRIVLNKCLENYPVDELPIPDFSDLPAGSYLFDKRPMTFIITSRGCPHRCSFCSVHHTFGDHFRRRPNAQIMEEITTRYDQGFRVFDFEDDNLTFDQEAAKDLCRQLRETFIKRDVQFLAMNGISYLSLDAELLQLMRAAGFTHLNLSLVSADHVTRSQAGRPHGLSKYLEIVGQAAQLGFKTVSYQILGLPGEALESMIETLTLAAGLPVLLGASVFYLTPGSPIAQNFPAPSASDCLKARLTAMAIETPQAKRADLYTLFITSRIINFLKGLKPEPHEISLSEALATARRSDTRSKTGAELLEILFSEKTLYAATSRGRQKLARFNAELFFRVWNRLERIATQGGCFIRLSKNSRL